MGGNIYATRFFESKDDIQHLSPAAWLMIELYVDSFERWETMAFVASLTQKGDLLSQWRGYNGGRGFAIGIDLDWLKANASAQQFSLVAVQYNESDQKLSAKTALSLLLQLITDAQGDPKRVGDAVVRWWKTAVRVALAFKNAHFSEEEEYRLIFRTETWPAETQFRASTGNLIPYIPYYLNKTVHASSTLHPNNVGLTEVIAGPNLRDHQLVTVEALFASQRMRVSVRKSEIPYVAD